MNTQDPNTLPQQNTQDMHTHTHTQTHTHTARIPNTIPQATGPTIPTTHSTECTGNGRQDDEEQNRRSQTENMTEQDFINQITNRVTLQLGSQLTEKFTPIFTTLHTNQSHLSRSIEQMVRRFDGQIGDITRRQDLQDITPHPNFSPVIVPNLTEVMPSIPIIPEYSQDCSSEIHQTETLKKLIGNIQDVSDPNNSKDAIWRQLYRLDHRVIPPFDTDPPTVEKMVDSHEALLNICIRCIRQLKNRRQTPLQTDTLTTTNEFKSGQQTIVKAISEDKNKKTKFF
eukprot:GHVR01051978.1.p1 GENE.GHVR01051978.1~~GHVR01051978.1.p1  ORF type:complete len:284 (-),score=5.31 GHVR01051978.1:503-1354(-)